MYELQWSGHTASPCSLTSTHSGIHLESQLVKCVLKRRENYAIEQRLEFTTITKYNKIK